MAAKKTLVEKAMSSKVVKGAMGFIDDAVSVVGDAMTLTPARKAPKRTTAKTAAVKKATARKSAGTMDRKLVSTMEDYEVKYLAQKHKVTQKAVKEAVAKVGHSRNKVEAALKAGKTKA